jgi:hypothetical protein
VDHEDSDQSTRTMTGGSQRRRMLRPGRMPRGLQHRAPVTVVLEHRVRGITPTRQVFETSLRQDVGWQFSGIDWPADLHPGVLVIVT